MAGISLRDSWRLRNGLISTDSISFLFVSLFFFHKLWEDSNQIFPYADVTAKWIWKLSKWQFYLSVCPRIIQSNAGHRASFLWEAEQRFSVVLTYRASQNCLQLSLQLTSATLIKWLNPSAHLIVRGRVKNLRADRQQTTSFLSFALVWSWTSPFTSRGLILPSCKINGLDPRLSKVSSGSDVLCSVPTSEL